MFSIFTTGAYYIFDQGLQRIQDKCTELFRSLEARRAVLSRIWIGRIRWTDSADVVRVHARGTKRSSVIATSLYRLVSNCFLQRVLVRSPMSALLDHVFCGRVCLFLVTSRFLQA